MGKGGGDGEILLLITVPFIIADAVILNGLNLYPFDRDFIGEGEEGDCWGSFKCGGNHTGKDKVKNLCLGILGLPFTPFACLCEATGCGKCISNAMQKVSKYDGCGSCCSMHILAIRNSTASTAIPKCHLNYHW